MANQPKQLYTEPKIANETILTKTTSQNSIRSPHNVSEKQQKPSTSNVKIDVAPPAKNEPLKTITAINLNASKNAVYSKWKKNIGEFLNKLSKTSKQTLISKKTLSSQLQNETTKKFLERIKPQKTIEKQLRIQTFLVRSSKSIHSVILLFKIVITTATIYSTTQLGIWGSTKDSNNAAKAIVRLFKGRESTKGLDYEKYDVKFKERYNETMKFVVGQTKMFPEKASKFYNLTVHYITNKIKSD